jgi:hypothetical protein
MNKPMDEFDLLLQQIIEEESGKERTEYEQRERSYEQREFDEAWKKWREIERGPLQDRQEGRAKWKKSMIEHPEIVAERVGWMLNGHWGHGVMLLMRRAVTNAKSDMAKVSRAAQIAAAFEWTTSGAFARQAWGELTKVQQKKVNRLVLDQIKKWEQEQKEENEES